MLVNNHVLQKHAVSPAITVCVLITNSTQHTESKVHKMLILQNV